MEYIVNYLNELMKTSKHTYPLFNPHTREKILDIPDCSRTQFDHAIKNSKKAFEIMKSMSSFDRANILEHVGNIIETNIYDFAKLISLESAKPINLARQEVCRTVQTFKFASVEARKMEGESIRLDAAQNGKGRDAYTIFEPLGIVGAITPFNFPLNLVAHKVGPALAAGNSIIVKPAEKTPLTSIKLIEAFEQAGLPEGALQVITGDGPRIGKYLIEEPEIMKISFTGSPEVGKLIKSQVGLKRITLELGNNSALYVDSSVSEKLDEIAKQAVAGSFSYNGQVCISTQRIYVHKDVLNEFLDKFKVYTKNLRYGDPMDGNTDITGVIDEKSQNRILNWVNEAVIEGAELICGGEKIDCGIMPTILYNVRRDSKVSTNEVFGPVVIINSVDCADQALSAMNDSDYGLNAGVFTYNLPQAMMFAHGLEVGQVLINDIPTLRFDHMPYGGLKSSGYGYEGVKYAIREMVNMKFISLNYEF